MKPQQPTFRAAKRAIKSLTVAAVSLGLAATLFAPGPAAAAPVNGPAASGQPDLAALVMDFYDWSPGQYREIGIAILNRGNTGAANVSVLIKAGTGFLHPAARGAGFSCTDMERIPYPDGPAYITCTTPSIARDSHKALSFRADARDFGEYTITVTVDPRNRVDELDENNNVSISRY